MSFDLARVRRELHGVPEIAFAEKQTKALLLKHLGELDTIKIHEFSKSYGILVEYSQGDGDYRLFRADMDALPITEKTGCDFASSNPGMMHACGHDIHMTVLLGLIAEVVKLRPQRNLLFLFQPAEEGQGGAESVLSEGLIQSYPVGEVYALHVGSGLPVGYVSSRAGIFFGIPQEFDVLFRGKTSHVAYPEKGVDALQAGIGFLNLMDADMAELSRNERVIFHVGKMAAGSIRNVLADTCTLEGTQRSLAKATRDKINYLILKNCALVARETGAEYNVEFLCSYDPVINSAKLVEALRGVCEISGIIWQEAEIAMTGEDFGFFTSSYPGLLFWLGSGCEHPLHSDRFLPDPACIEVGVKVFSLLAMR